MKRISKNKMEKKDFSAPWALGLGATRRAAMLLVMLLTMAQTTWAQEAAVYDLVTEVPTVDGGQSTNWNTEYDYYSLVDGNTSTIYGISNANPWVEFHYSRAFVPKKLSSGRVIVGPLLTIQQRGLSRRN